MAQKIFEEGKHLTNINFDDMKKLIILIVLIIIALSLKAQSMDKYQDSSLEFSYLDKYPYRDVLSLLGYPDTLLFCHYPSRRYDEENVPDIMALYLYKSDGLWWATTLFEYHYKKIFHWYHRWELTKPLWVHPDLSSEFSDAIADIKNINYIGDVSIIHSWVYIKQGDGNIVAKSLIGNYREISEIAPAFSYVFTVAALESSNLEIIKTYREKY